MTTSRPVALVTGASSGIGKAAALALVEAGYEVVGTSRDASRVTDRGGVTFLDLVVMRFRLRRELARRFPEEPLKGTTYYAVMRSLQMKFMRLPKAKVKIGAQLPDDYR